MAGYVIDRIGDRILQVRVGVWPMQTYVDHQTTTQRDPNKDPNKDYIYIVWFIAT